MDRKRMVLAGLGGAVGMVLLMGASPSPKPNRLDGTAWSVSEIPRDGQRGRHEVLRFQGGEVIAVMAAKEGYDKVAYTVEKVPGGVRWKATFTNPRKNKQTWEGTRSEAGMSGTVSWVRGAKKGRYSWKAVPKASR